MRWWTAVGLVILFVVRVDLWWWHDAGLIGALPVGLAYHVAYCFLVAGFFLLVVKRCWPKELDALDSGVQSSREAQP